MAARVRVLELERLGERLDAGEEQLLEPPRLHRDALLEALLVGAVLEDEPPLLERLRDARADVLELVRLGDVVHGADGEAVHGDLDVGDGGDHHDRGVGQARADLSQQLEAVHLRHAQVAQHERDGVLLELLERLDAVRRLDALKAVVSHQVHQHLAQARLVVDDEAVRSGVRDSHRARFDVRLWAAHAVILRTPPGTRVSA